MINIKRDFLLGNDLQIPMKKFKPTVPGHGPGECICVIPSSGEEDTLDTSVMPCPQQQQQLQETTPTVAQGDDVPASQFEEGQRFETSEPTLQYEVAFDADNEPFHRFPNTGAFNTRS
ncbi:uncharacterized protein LOC103316992 [Nasonia vitripennis]|uniref:Uncharacterized protein n=1 Tax=Nasonia vitripennis TaxID=7425 RepID=A0A7M7HED3_NASVI|nr:uncharacterized protein LOC103316992 [Nasonia vitripennis]